MRYRQLKAVSSLRPRSHDVRRMLRHYDRIETMARLHWEAYVNRGRTPLIHKGGKP